MLSTATIITSSNSFYLLYCCYYREGVSNVVATLTVLLGHAPLHHQHTAVDPGSMVQYLSLQYVLRLYSFHGLLAKLNILRINGCIILVMAVLGTDTDSGSDTLATMTEYKQDFRVEVGGGRVLSTDCWTGWKSQLLWSLHRHKLYVEKKILWMNSCYTFILIDTHTYGLACVPIIYNFLNWGEGSKQYILNENDPVTGVHVSTLW